MLFRSVILHPLECEMKILFGAGRVIDVEVEYAVLWNVCWNGRAGGGVSVSLGSHMVSGDRLRWWSEIAFLNVVQYYKRGIRVSTEPLARSPQRKMP